MVCSDTSQETRFPAVMAVLRQLNVRSFCALPLTSGQHRLGAVGFGSVQPIAYSSEEVAFLQRVANLVALAVENSTNREALRREKERLEAILQVSDALAKQEDPCQLLPGISSSLGQVLKHDYLSLAIRDVRGNGLQLFEVVPGTSPELISRQLSDDIDHYVRPAELPDPSRVTLFTRSELENMRSTFARDTVNKGVESVWYTPLLSSKGLFGAFCVGSRNEQAVNGQETDILRQLAAHLAIALENASARRQIAELKDKLAQEKLYLEDEIRTELNFEQIIGESPALKDTLTSARTVAPSDASVLILGETGTGKELIARAIHDMSPRRGKSFIKVNCAAIPTGLLESELFGHEKGAFTGALTQKIGRLELADGGTLFLDEVGDIALELQPKLLRVLQDHEFERLGSTRTCKVNVRIIAATNRDLKRSVDAGEFRRDLFYRLNVFPIAAPPLRDRRRDIPLLVRYFVQRFARRMNKPIETIPAENMNALVNWDWPGNVRELENFIERSVILTRGRALEVPVAELKAPEDTTAKKDLTLMAAEREHILRALREASGVISGTRGAAARLGLKRTTLQSKMQKLGIRRQDYEN